MTKRKDYYKCPNCGEIVELTFNRLVESDVKDVIDIMLTHSPITKILLISMTWRLINTARLEEILSLLEEEDAIRYVPGAGYLLLSNTVVPCNDEQ